MSSDTGPDTGAGPDAGIVWVETGPDQRRLMRADRGTSVGALAAATCEALGLEGDAAGEFAICLGHWTHPGAAPDAAGKIHMKRNVILIAHCNSLPSFVSPASRRNIHITTHFFKDP